MKTIAIDSGSSFLKGISEAGRVKFHAITYELPRNVDHPKQIVVKNRRYMVGRTALAVGATPQEPGKQVKFHGSDQQHVQICQALNNMGVEGKQDTLVLSLPYFDAAGPARKEEVARICKTRTFSWSTAAKEDVTVTFKNATIVLPQGAGALRRYQADCSDRPDTVLMVDIGSCTLDLVVLRWDGEGYHYHEASTSLRTVNVQEFKNHWLKEVQRSDGAQNHNPHYHDMMQHALDQQWQMRIRANVVGIGPAFEATKLWFAQQVSKAIEETLPEDLLVSVDRIILSGGGAQFIDCEAWNDPRLITLDVFANAEGQYLTGLGLADDPVGAAAALAELPRA